VGTTMATMITAVLGGLAGRGAAPLHTTAHQSTPHKTHAGVRPHDTGREGAEDNTGDTGEAVQGKGSGQCTVGRAGGGA